MKCILTGKDLWDIVEGSEVIEDDFTEKQLREFRKRDRKAHSLICLSVSADLKIYVRPTKTSKEAWDALANRFVEKTLSKIIEYRRKLYSARMENKTMSDHVNNLKTISEHLESLDDPVVEKDLVMILISSLPEEYNNLITTLETLERERLTWEYVRDRVMTEYDRKKREKKST